MFFDTQKYICSNCKTVFERTFFEAIHCKLQKCPKCGSYNIRSLNSLEDIIKKQPKNDNKKE